MKSVFVGNMSFLTTENDLRELFKPFGEVTRIHLVTDRETGRARGFAFVEMPNDQEVANAIASLNGRQVSDRSLKVSRHDPGQTGKDRELAAAGALAPSSLRRVSERLLGRGANLAGSEASADIGRVKNQNG